MPMRAPAPIVSPSRTNATMRRAIAPAIAKEIGTPNGRNQSDPAERRPQPTQRQADRRESRNEPVPLAMHGRELGADRIDSGHAFPSGYRVAVRLLSRICCRDQGIV